MPDAEEEAMKHSTIVAAIGGFLVTAALGLIWNNSIENRDSCVELRIKVHILEKDNEGFEKAIERLQARP